MENAIEVFEPAWLSEFWIPEVVVYNQTFDSELFDLFLKKYEIKKRPLSSRRHNKTVIDSKLCVIRDVYFRLKAGSECDPTVTKSVMIEQALRITNNLYRDDVASAYELAKGYSMAVENGAYSKILPNEVYNAHENLNAKRKLSLIQHSKSVQTDDFTPVTNVQVHVKKRK